MMNPNRANETEIRRALLTLFLMAGAVAFSFYAVKIKNPIFFISIFFLPFALKFLTQPALLLVGLVWVEQASFKVPGLPGGLKAIHLFSLMIIGWTVLNIALRDKQFRKIDSAGKALLLFLFTMCLVISVRGFGISIGGNMVYGGAKYIHLAIMLFLYFASDRFSLNQKEVKLIFFGGLFASIIPFLIQISAYVTGGGTSYLTNFVDVDVLSAAKAAFVDGGEATTVRWSALGNFSIVLLAMAFVLPMMERHRILSWALVFLSVSMVLLTGFRSSLVGYGTLIFIWTVYNSKNRSRTFLSLTVFGVLGWFLVLLVLPVLPEPMQRAFSFLPFADARVDSVMLEAAAGSVDFRLEIWRMCWDALPRYFLVGRGLAENVSDYAWVNQSWYGTPQFFYFMHAYHSGPWALLQDFGFPGLVAGVWFMWSICADAWKGVKKYCVGNNDLISRYYAFLTIQLTYSCVAFYLIFGALTFLPPIIINAVILRALRKEMASRRLAPRHAIVAP